MPNQEQTIVGLQEPTMTDAELAKFRADSAEERKLAASQDLGHNALVGFSDGTVGTPTEAQDIIANDQDRSGAYDGHGRE